MPPKISVLAFAAECLRGGLYATTGRNARVRASGHIFVTILWLIEQGHGFESVIVRSGLNAWVRFRRFGPGRRGSHRKRDCSRLDGWKTFRLHNIP
jgi:hypothetical protein